MNIEYKVVPAPEKARKQRGLKGAALFAHSIEAVMNELAAEGWQYLRADTLPQDERSGLTTRTTTYRNLLVFQRPVADDEPDVSPVPETAPEEEVLEEEAVVEPQEEEEITNLWEAEDSSEPAPLVADRQGERVDL